MNPERRDDSRSETSDWRTALREVDAAGCKG